MAAREQRCKEVGLSQGILMGIESKSSLYNQQNSAFTVKLGKDPDDSLVCHPAFSPFLHKDKKE